MPPHPSPEVWQRGPIDGIPPLLMPIAHALTQAVEDLDRICRPLSPEALWSRPAGAASLAFHLQHVAGSTDRLFTYARGERLDAEQRRQLDAENAGTDHGTGAEALLARLRETVARALDQLRRTTDESLLEPRTIGRAALPTNTIGLLFHAAEHAMRHVGQAIVTARGVGGFRAS